MTEFRDVVSALPSCGPITTVTAKLKFAGLCLALTRNPFAYMRGNVCSWHKADMAIALNDASGDRWLS